MLYLSGCLGLYTLGLIFLWMQWSFHKGKAPYVDHNQLKNLELSNQLCLHFGLLIMAWLSPLTKLMAIHQVGKQKAGRMKSLPFSTFRHRQKSAPDEWKVCQCVFRKLLLRVCSFAASSEGENSSWDSESASTSWSTSSTDKPLGVAFTVFLPLSAPTTTTSSFFWLRRTFSLFVFQSLNIGASKCCSDRSHRCLPSPGAKCKPLSVPYIQIWPA